MTDVPVHPLPLSPGAPELTSSQAQAPDALLSRGSSLSSGLLRVQARRPHPWELFLVLSKLQFMPADPGQGPRRIALSLRLFQAPAEMQVLSQGRLAYDQEGPLSYITSSASAVRKAREPAFLAAPRAHDAAGPQDPTVSSCRVAARDCPHRGALSLPSRPNRHTDPTANSRTPP